jgi:GNAT superfamily N-acetyltransferase
MTGFTAEVDEYVILTLALKDYKPSTRSLPGGYTLLPAGADCSPYRDQEKKLLQHYFVVWAKPFGKKLDGLKNDSPILVTRKGELIAGVYLCDRNELRRARWGQLHYAFIEPSHGGKGIYSVVFKEAIERARRWNLEGLVLNSDRFMLPEVYRRWGAIELKRVRKDLLRKIAGRAWNLLQRNER